MSFLPSLLGGNKSSVSVKSLTNVISNTFISSAQDCSKSAVATTVLNVDGSGNILQDIDLSSSAVISSSCMQSDTVVNDVREAVKAEFAQIGSQQAGIISLSQNDSKQLQDIETNIVTNITSETLQKCASNAFAQANITIRGDLNIISKVKMNSTVSILNDCVKNSIFTNSVSTDLALSSIQKNTQKTEGISDIISSIAQALTGVLGELMVFIILIAFILLILIGMLLYFCSKSRSCSVFWPMMQARSAVNTILCSDEEQPTTEDVTNAWSKKYGKTYPNL